MISLCGLLKACQFLLCIKSINKTTQKPTYLVNVWSYLFILYLYNVWSSPLGCFAGGLLLPLPPAKQPKGEGGEGGREAGKKRERDREKDGKLKG
jgi:hypothetical protein